MNTGQYDKTQKPKEGSIILWESDDYKVEMSDKACFNYIILPLFFIFLILMLRRPVQSCFTREHIRVKPGRGITYRARRININNQWHYISLRMKRIPYDHLTTWWMDGRYYHCLEYTDERMMLYFRSTTKVLRPSDRLALIRVNGANATCRGATPTQSELYSFLASSEWYDAEIFDNHVWFPGRGTLFIINSMDCITDILIFKPDADYVVKE